MEGETLPASPIIIDEDNINQPSKRLKTTSKVWEDFTKLTSEDTNEINAKCKHCNALLSASGKNGTSHLKRHLERYHPSNQHDVRQYLLSTEANMDGTTSIKNYKFDQDSVRTAISLFVVCGEHPFTIVEERGFKYLLSVACPQFKQVSRFTTKRDIMSLYDGERSNLQEIITKVPSRICFTSDNWKSNSTKDHYICITAHFIDSNWKLQKRIIRFRVLIPPHDGLSVADDVALCFSEWNIENKIMSITLDNASYNDSMVTSLKRRLLSKNKFLCRGEFFQIRCYAHILNLIVQTGLKLIDDVVDKIRDGINYIKASSVRKHKFYEVAERSFQLNINKKLCGDMIVRWNSTYKMLDHALYYKNVLNYTGERDSTFMTCFGLSEIEWDKIAKIHKFLKVFYEVTCTFSGTKYPTSNLYFKEVFKVHTRLLEFSHSPYNFMTDMIKEMQGKFDKYWSEYNLILSCAAVLDPRYKLKFVTYCFKKIYGLDAHIYIEKIDQTLRMLFEEYKQDVSTITPICRSSSVSSNIADKDNDCDVFEDYDQYDGDALQIQKSQLELYLEEPVRDLNSELDILDYWSKTSMRYPDLAEMARDILTIPVSTVASESAFSLGRKVISPCRSALKSKTVQALICLQDWLHAKENLGKDTISEVTRLASTPREDSASSSENDD